MDFNNLWSDVDLKNQKQNTRCLALNTILAGKYLVGPVLGLGGFGITYLGYDLNMETRVAIKEYFPVELVSRDTTTMHGDRVLSLSGEKSVTYQQGLKKYVAEARNVSQFADVPGVVSVKDFFYENETAYIVMEYIDGISLKDYLKEKGGRLSEAETLAIMKPVLEALEKVHRAGVIHRDISPDNIMLTFEKKGTSGAQPSVSGQSSTGGRIIHSVKLIDFGAARMTSKNDQKSLTIILKHGYAPEEQYRTRGEQGAWTDVYAVCAVMYKMLTGMTPVPAMDRLFKDELKSFKELGFSVGSDTAGRSDTAGTTGKAGCVSSKTAAVLLKGMAVKKENRIQSMEELVAALYHGALVRDQALEQKKKVILLGSIGAAALLVLVIGAVFLGLHVRKNGTENFLANGATGIGAEGIGADGIDTDGIGADGIGAEGSGVTGDSLSSSERDESAEGVAGDGQNGEGLTGTNQTDQSSMLLELGSGEEELGPQIVWSTPDTMIAAGLFHFLSLRDDGTVKAVGSNNNSQCEVTDWDHVAAVYAGRSYSAALRTDGTVLLTGNKNLKAGTQSWSGIVQLAPGSSHILGLTVDGTVVSAGDDSEGSCDTGDWKDVVSIWAVDDLSIGITSQGELLTAGTLEGQEDVVEKLRSWKNVQKITARLQADYTFYGITKDGKLLVAGQLEDSVDDIQDASSVVDMESGDGFWVALKEDGTLLHTGRFDELSEWKDVIAITGTQYHVIGLKSDGSLIVTEGDLSGNSTLEEILALENVRQAVWSSDCLYVLCEDGTLKITGYVEYWRDEATEEGNWTDIRELAGYGDGVAAITSEGKVIRTDEGTLSYDYDRESSLSRKEQVDLAWEHKRQTPDLMGSWKNVAGISCSDKHIAALLRDGTVRAAGYAELQSDTDYTTGLTFDGACEVENWTGIKQILAMSGRTIGLKEDGTLICTGDMPESWKQWKDLDSIYGYGHQIMAIAKDGTVVNVTGTEAVNGMTNTSTWTDMVKLSVGNVHMAGLRSDGTVAAAGANYCGQCDVEEWTDIVSIAVGSCATVGITSEGRIVMAGLLPNDIFVAESWPALDMTKILGKTLSDRSSSSNEEDSTL